MSPNSFFYPWFLHPRKGIYQDSVIIESCPHPDHMHDRKYDIHSIHIQDNKIPVTKQYAKNMMWFSGLTYALTLLCMMLSVDLSVEFKGFLTGTSLITFLVFSTLFVRMSLLDKPTGIVIRPQDKSVIHDMLSDDRATAPYTMKLLMNCAGTLDKYGYDSVEYQQAISEWNMLYNSFCMENITNYAPTRR